MSKTFKNVFAKAALEIFQAHPYINEIWVTSDEEGFTDPNKAKDHERYLNEKGVEFFKRGFEDSYTEPEKKDSLDATKQDPANTKKPEQVTKPEKQPENPGNGIEAATAEKNALVLKYKELYGAEPAANISIEELKAKIAEKAPGQTPASPDPKKDKEDKQTKA